MNTRSRYRELTPAEKILYKSEIDESRKSADSYVFGYKKKEVICEETHSIKTIAYGECGWINVASCKLKTDRLKRNIIFEVSLEILANIISEKKPLGLYYSQEGEQFIAVNNQEGHSVVSEFDNKIDCFNYLNGTYKVPNNDMVDAITYGIHHLHSEGDINQK